MLTDQEIAAEMSCKHTKSFYVNQHERYLKYWVGITASEAKEIQKVEKEYEQIKEDVRRKNMRLSEL